MRITTQHSVTLHDLNTRTASTMTAKAADEDLTICRHLGDTLQEHTFRDRAGNPLRIVHRIATPTEGPPPNQGGVPEFTDHGGIYEFTL